MTRQVDPEFVRPHVLREYALVADGERGALTGPDGHIVWMCAPRWDSEPVFSGLIGGRGTYQVTPADSWAVWSGEYEPGTLIWRNQWVTRDTIVHSRDAMALPGDPHRAVLLRQLVATDQAVRLVVRFAPRPGFAGHELRDLRRVDGVWTAHGGSLHLRWSGAADAEEDPDRPGCLRLVLDLEPGRRHDLMLEISDRQFDEPPPLTETTWQATEATWGTTVPDMSDTLAPRDAGHAYAVLRGLTSSSGAMVAAATTSLPERARAGANYDYRYAWIRDQCWVGQAVAAHGPHPLLEDAVRFVTERLLADGPALRPAYRVDGGLVPREVSLDLAGYPGGDDCVGNRVTDQFQLDVFGEALLLLAAAARWDALGPDAWRAVETAVDAIRDRWSEPDAGVWELDDRPWTHSRLTCVAGLRAAAGIAPAEHAAAWSALADTILADVSSWGIHAQGHWRRAADDDRVDAALLLPAIRGAVPADDPRSVATLRTVRSDLAVDGYVYRFRHDDRPLNRSEGAFMVCGFLMAIASHRHGDALDAVRWFERNRAACGPPGLFTEEYNVRQRQPRGNLPQAFVHGLLLESATLLARPAGS
jgi:hypothetical protein